MASRLDEQYTYVKLLTRGGFGAIHVLEQKETGTQVILKLEENVTENSIIKEVEMYSLLHGAGQPPGFAEMQGAGKVEGKGYIILNKLGPSLQNVFIANRGILPIKYVLKLARSALLLIKRLHSLGFIHNDIKPSNFVLGSPGSKNHDILHLLDFGVCTKYVRIVNDEYRQHVEINKNVFDQGTISYGSHRRHELLTPTRRDDLESLIYTIVFMIKGCLPWNKFIGCSRDQESMMPVIQMKKNIDPKEFFDGMPKQMIKMFNHVRYLGPLDEPDYDLLEKLIVKAKTSLHPIWKRIPCVTK